MVQRWKMSSTGAVDLTLFRGCATVPPRMRPARHRAAPVDVRSPERRLKTSDALLLLTVEAKCQAHLNLTYTQPHTHIHTHLSRTRHTRSGLLHPSVQCNCA